MVAVLVKVGLRAAIVLRPKDPRDAAEHCAVHRRIGDDREVEQALLELVVEQRVRNPVPVRRSAIVEVNIDLLNEIRVEPESRVR